MSTGCFFFKSSRKISGNTKIKYKPWVSEITRDAKYGEKVKNRLKLTATLFVWHRWKNNL
jgi:hypothetical protein